MLHTRRNEASGNRSAGILEGQDKATTERASPSENAVKECKSVRMRCILNSVVHCSRLFDSREKTCKHRGSEAASYQIDVLFVSLLRQDVASFREE